ncbi:MAG TPA: glycosyltransferase [Azospirillum sp.]|nr:glycosyltransferase [Azospirillum sp.]
MNSEPSSAVWLTALVLVTERAQAIEALIREYRRGLDAIGRPYEIVCVLDGEYPEALAALNRVTREGCDVTIVSLARPFGEAACLGVGAVHARGEVILTLPSYPQVPGAALPRLIAALDAADMIVARRAPRVDGLLRRAQTAVFNGLVGVTLGRRFHDLGCGVRVMRREVAGELDLYGDQHRFLPLIAHSRGFRVKEIALPQHPDDRDRPSLPPGIWMRRLLDIISIVFLLKFTMKPLRFFGLLGTGSALAGGLLGLVLVVQRLLFEMPLAERPALLLAVLLIVLGVQLVAIGLIGEVIIFTRGRRTSPYRVTEVIGR